MERVGPDDAMMGEVNPQVRYLTTGTAPGTQDGFGPAVTLETRAGAG